MSLFPDIAGQPLERLEQLFVSDAACRDHVDEKDLWLQEIAAQIARNGNEGLIFLLRTIGNSNPSRARAVLLAFSFLDPVVAKERSAELKEALLACLTSDEPLLVAQAIDALNDLGMEVRDEVNALVNHPSPYVVGSVLRFMSRRSPGEAKPILLRSLGSKDPIIRQNAIDELDALECKEALEPIRSLVNDGDKNVRQAAQTAIKHLEVAGISAGNGAPIQPARRD